MINHISSLIMPLILVGILGYGTLVRISVFDTFLDGAAKGLRSAINILPALIGLICAVSMLRASGFLDFLAKITAPFLKTVGMPEETLSLAILKPFSGSGALAIIKDLFDTHGADSKVGRIASVMLGSSETTFYAIAVYFGAVKIKNIRHTAVCAIIADIAGIFASVVICNMLYR